MSIRGNGGHTRCPALQCKAFPCTTLFFFFTPNSPHFALFSPQIHSYFAPVSPKFRPCSPLFHPNSSNRLFCFFILRLSVLFNQFLALFFNDPTMIKIIKKINKILNEICTILLILHSLYFVSQIKSLQIALCFC